MSAMNAEEREEWLAIVTGAVLTRAAEKGGLYRRYITEELAREFAEAALNAIEVKE